MCTELGRAAREAALAQAKVALEGFNIKQGMINEGKILQEERASQLAGEIYLHIFNNFSSTFLKLFDRTLINLLVLVSLQEP